ncbi:hypothetical protein AGLY_018105 [Aphis glycines]|uniref:Uncharacterized protein n=1 Tax=Aphis glycines TaxID=307491 RepID=A0A6G0ST04_APHGL|nr:hypothetical protein AGLY_018105 [Aphis glycines]
MQESHKIARENLIKRKIKSKLNYDSNENSIEISLEIFPYIFNIYGKWLTKNLETNPAFTPNIAGVSSVVILENVFQSTSNSLRYFSTQLYKSLPVVVSVIGIKSKSSSVTSKLSKTPRIKIANCAVFVISMALAQTKPYRISRFIQENGMYFENQGPLHLTNSDWKLLIYVKLDNFNRPYEGMFKITCDNFKLTSNNLEQEVSRKRFFMLQSIDERDTVNWEKRGLVNLTGRVQKTLFGTLDDTDAELYVRQIEKLQSKKQTSVLKATTYTFKEANQMEAQINRLIEARTNINEQLNTLNLLFQQLSF